VIQIFVMYSSSVTGRNSYKLDHNGQTVSLLCKYSQKTDDPEQELMPSAASVDE